MSNARNLSKLFSLQPFLSALLSLGAQGAEPAGVVKDFAGTVLPAGYLWCGGGVASQTEYPALYIAIGDTFNVGGEGAGNFRLPDLRGRVIAGKDNMGGVAANRLTSASSGILGTTLGNAGGSQTHTLTTAQIPPHSHGINTGDTNPGGGSLVYRATDGLSGQTTGSAGSGEAHPIVQPTMILNKIIKT